MIPSRDKRGLPAKRGDSDLWDLYELLLIKLESVETVALKNLSSRECNIARVTKSNTYGKKIDACKVDIMLCLQFHQSISADAFDSASISLFSIPPNGLNRMEISLWESEFCFKFIPRSNFLGWMIDIDVGDA